jgi:DNA polymerase-3 subunit gamma/tau
MGDYVILGTDHEPQGEKDFENSVLKTLLPPGVHGMFAPDEEDDPKVFTVCIKPFGKISPEGEPCNLCSSCIEIAKGASLDVIEIDGASNRGIDDIRGINETLPYATFQGKYKIYLIDEVHMLTKEAFNALLKSLEEPPKNVKFFFATTEPQKVLPTILSRCQRFDLTRIRPFEIIKKLRSIAKEINVEIEDEALGLIAKLAEGSLRDAESLLDQVLCSNDSPITKTTIVASLALMGQEHFFALDEAYEKGR